MDSAIGVGRVAKGLAGGSACVLMALKGGAAGVLEINAMTPVKAGSQALMGSKRYVEIDYPEQAFDVWSNGPGQAGPADLSGTGRECEHERVTPRKERLVRSALLDFSGAVAGKRKPLVTGEDGIEAVRIVEAALKSIRDRKVVEL